METVEMKFLETARVYKTFPLPQRELRLLFY